MHTGVSSMNRVRALTTSLILLPLQTLASITYYHTDLLGSPVMATNEQAQIVWQASYLPFGQKVQSLANQASAHANPVGFTGHADDPESGLIYMQARYYDPRLGRFLRPDPKDIAPLQPGSFNRYAYANNNPYKFVDPDGKDALVFNISVQATLLENIAHYWLGTNIRITGASVGVGFSLADSNGNGIPEADVGIVGSLDIDGVALGGSRVNFGIQRSLNKDPSLADLVGFGTAVAIGGPGLGGKLSIAENGVVMLEGQAGAIVPGASIAGQGIGICSVRSGCMGWNSLSDTVAEHEFHDEPQDQTDVNDDLRAPRHYPSAW